MVDILRAYRRWLIKRLSYLLPVFLCALAANVWLAVGVETERWFKVISLVISGLSLSALGYLLFETLSCAALQARGDRRAARALRGQLAMSWRVTGVCIVVFTALLYAPLLLRVPSPEAPRAAHARQSFVVIEPASPDFTQIPPAQEQPALAAAEQAGPVAQTPASAPPTRPDIRPVIADVPSRLEVEEKEFDPPMAAAPFLQPPQDPPRRVEPDSMGLENLVYRPEIPRLEAFPPAEYGLMVVNRLGLRGEEDENAPPPTFRLDFLLVSMEGYGRGGGTGLEGDYPVGRDGSVHVAYLGVGFGKGQELDELQSEWVWHRLTLGYQHRVLGYTRHAAFDLALTVGASVDRFMNEVGPEEIDTKARISPYAAVDIGIWQGGPFGFVLHAGHSLPFNLTGSSSAVTDVSAIVRVDVSERFSFFAGYRMLWMDLKEYPENLVTSHAHEEFESSMAGPLIGFEYRF